MPMPADWCVCRARVTMTNCTMESIHIQDAWHNSFNLVCWVQLQPSEFSLSQTRKSCVRFLKKFKVPRCITCHPYISKHILETFFLTKYAQHSAMLQNRQNDTHYMSSGKKEATDQRYFIFCAGLQGYVFDKQVLFLYTVIQKTLKFFRYLVMIKLRMSYEVTWVNRCSISAQVNSCFKLICNRRLMSIIQRCVLFSQHLHMCIISISEWAKWWCRDTLEH